MISRPGSQLGIDTKWKSPTLLNVSKTGDLPLHPETVYLYLRQAQMDSARPASDLIHPHPDDDSHGGRGYDQPRQSHSRIAHFVHTRCL